MNREIKFRVWDKHNKKFCDWREASAIVGTDNSETQMRCGIIELNNNESSDYIFSQYTGLKDKNGKEIYESDIIQIKDRFVMWSKSKGQIVEDVNAVVVWSGDGFIPQRLPNTRLWILDMEQYEVVGNIYENPELLEGIK